MSGDLVQNLKRAGEQVLGAKGLTGNDHVRLSLSALLKVAALEIEALRVARDEAAELRAENAELRAAGHQSVRLIEWLSSREGTALEDAAEAEALVNRLRAALAASEGES